LKTITILTGGKNCQRCAGSSGLEELLLFYKHFKVFIYLSGKWQRDDDSLLHKEITLLKEISSPEATLES